MEQRGICTLSHGCSNSDCSFPTCYSKLGGKTVHWFFRGIFLSNKNSKEAMHSGLESQEVKCWVRVNPPCCFPDSSMRFSKQKNTQRKLRARLYFFITCTFTLNSLISLGFYHLVQAVSMSPPWWTFSIQWVWQNPRQWAWQHSLPHPYWFFGYIFWENRDF